MLCDGEVFEGVAAGAPAEVAAGEVVFNTVMCGYQEVVSDPSYAGQVITFTSAHIGNYGTNPQDDESQRPHCRGVVMSDLSHHYSNWRATTSLHSWLRVHGVPAIAGIDTRRLARHVRDAGAMPGAFGTATTATLEAAARAEPGTTGVNLVQQVSTPEAYTVGSGPRRVVAYDLGIKAQILRQLARHSTVVVVPASTPVGDVLAMEPDGVFLSNGPGDPTEVGALTAELPALVGRVPLFGICLGHQVLALALGGRTFKMRFGHHGGNVPVRHTASGRVEITSQNHNFAVASGSVPGVTETHVCLNDHVVEGMTLNGADAFSVQFHPEAGPGPHDCRHYFTWFAEMMERARASS